MSDNTINFKYNKLPPSLSKSEIYELMENMYNGDRSAREKLINCNIRLVIHIVITKFSTVDYDKDDLISIGTIGLIKAVDTFDTSKNIEFATYAGICINNEILMFLRKLKKDQIVDSFDMNVAVDKNGSELKLEDILFSDMNLEEEYLDNELYQTIREMVADLPYRDRELVMMNYGFYDGRIYTHAEIGKKFNLSRSFISKLIRRVIKKLKNQLSEYEFIEVKKCKVNHNLKKTKTIYQRLSEYTREEVDVMLSKLDEEDKEIIKIRYGEDLDYPNPSEEWEEEYNKVKFETLVYRMKKMLKNPNKEIKKRNKSKTIYEYFSEYTREEVDVMLSKLDESDKKLIKLRYGEDLDNPTSTLDSSDESYKEFYCALIPKIKRRLKNLNKLYSNQLSNESLESVVEEVKLREDSVIQSSNKLISKADYDEILDKIKSSMFDQFTNTLSNKVAIIIALTFGYVDGKCFSASDIANFLQISETEVRQIIINVMLAYKQWFNNYMDNVANIVNEEKENKKIIK